MLASCCLCGNTTFEKVFDLGILPLGFPIDPSTTRSDQIWREKLELVICTQCYLIQTVHKIPDEKIAAENLYLSGTSKSISDHDEQFSSDIPYKLSLSKDSLTLEIGCGDGSLLEKFRYKGFRNLIGVEPMVHPTQKYPFEVIVDFFNADVVRALKNRGMYPNCIIANYVIELIPELDLFFSNLEDLLAKGTFLVIEVPYFNDFINTFRIDGFAHLRCYWFTVNSLFYALDKHNMGVVDVEHDINYRGGTLRVIARKEYQGKIPDAVLDWKDREKEELNSRTFCLFRNKIRGLRKNIKAKIAQLRDEGMSICGYGGGLKASTLLNWLNLTAEEVKMVVDVDPNKQYKIIPVANIPIKPVSDLFDGKDRKAVVMLALDHAKEVEELLLNKLRKGSLVIYLLPEYRAITV